MKKRILSLLFVLLASPALADMVAPTRTIRSDAIIGANDLGLIPGSNPMAFTDVRDVLGQEARKTLYAGRPILLDDIGPPAIVTRNQIVSVQFISGGLRIMTEGRSLERGGIGDRVRIMNLSSRATLFGHVQADGTVKVFK